MSIQNWQIATSVLLFFFLPTFAACQKQPDVASTPEPTTASDRLKEAVKRVEEDRGQPTGRKVKLDVPAELRHYADRRRFLAVQNAAWREWHFEIPQGYVELIELIEKGGFVEMEALGDQYILYGAGENATTARFTHFDATSGKTIPLLGSREEFEEERKKRSDSFNQLETEKVDLKLQLSQTPAKARAARKMIVSRIAERETQSKELAEQLNLLDSFYRDAVRSEMLFARYRWLKTLAANFKGRSYNIDDPTGRRQFKMRLLAFTRPQTRAVILEIARAYQERFARHLPITSLFRTIEYQKQLREVNPNATGVDVPPHTTGLAFDVYDRWMNADEQSFLMGVIARMEAERRIEALRENRDHIHIFAFPSGKPPQENLIAKALQ